MSLPRPRLFVWPAVFAALWVVGCSRTEPAPPPVRAVKTMTVAGGESGATLEYAAEIRARTESVLGFRIGGKIARRNVDLGDGVKAGQALAQLDPAGHATRTGRGTGRTRLGEGRRVIRRRSI